MTISIIPENSQKPFGCQTCQWRRETETRCGCDEAHMKVVERPEVPENIGSFNDGSDFSHTRTSTKN